VRAVDRVRWLIDREAAEIFARQPGEDADGFTNGGTLCNEH
jgi:hypothetical protein